MVDFVHIIKKKVWLFLLFLIPSIFFVNLLNDFLFHLTMNSESMHNFVSYFALVIITILFVMVYSFIESKITKSLMRKTFKIIIILISVFFIFSNLMNILVYGLFKYDSCGKEFNELYVKNAKYDDSFFCLNLPSDIHTVTGFKGSSYCTTPNKDLVTPTQDHFAVTCITSFAKYTNNISHCDIIESKNLNGSKYSCMMDYAIDKLKPNLCETLPDKSRTHCLKTISWKSGDKSLCEKIPSSSSLKNACLDR